MLEKMAETAIAQGGFGLACVALCVVVWKLYADLKLEREQNAALVEAHQKQLQAVNDARITDSQSTMKLVLELARSIDRNTEVVKDAIEAFREAQRG